MKSRASVAAFAALLLLVVSGSASSAPAPQAAKAPKQMPDWLVVNPKGDDDGYSPPLTFLQVTKAVADSIAGPRLYGLRVTDGSTPFAGDRRLLTTVTPNGDGVRDEAIVHFRLERPATVRMTVYICSKHPRPIRTKVARFRAGNDRLEWAPPATTEPRTYLLLLAVTAGGKRHVYGNTDYRLAELQPAPVVRVMGISAGFTRRSYSPGDMAQMRISTDVPAFSLQMFQAGPEVEDTTGDSMQGVPVDQPRDVDWFRNDLRPGTLSIRVGNWPNGIHFAQLTDPNGVTWDAPLIVRPHPYGRNRIAVVLHTNTWHAYNHQDTDGDGWGNTWYATDENRSVDLSLPYIDHGAPPKWRPYDVPFLHWLYRTNKQVDFISDDDLESFKSARTLARLYDLIVFPGHEEYVTSHVYDLITGYRNLGGNLMFLAATNFLWKIDRHGDRITRVNQWRKLGRPESRIIGVQYRGSDEGTHRGPYELTAYGRTSWEFAGVDQKFIADWKWLGIEWDRTTSVSPRGIHVLAQVNPHMRTRGLVGQMTYYERGKAKVFASGLLNFPATACFTAYRRVLENVWDRLSQP